MKSDSNAKGGLPIKKQKDSPPESQNYTCPNPFCGKIFTSPLKTKNLSSKQTEVYDACPYCLTEITIEKPSMIIDLKEEVEIEKSETNVSHVKETPTTPPKVQECQHHMGYLSKRSKAEKIPEECMMCPKIVECMLKNVTG